jgi:hypothetical protein
MIVAGFENEKIVTALRERFPGKAALEEAAAWGGLNVLLAD